MNGGGEKSGWFCGRDGEFKRDGRCAIDAWCAGPFTAQTAIVVYGQELCIGGRLPLIIL